MRPYQGKTPADFAALVHSLSNNELASPFRSTIPLLAYWAEPATRLPDFAQALGLVLPTSMDMCFEYSVPVRAGRGKASQTDLMLISPEYAVAIEAKDTEPKYETAQSWLRSSTSSRSFNNRIEVLDGWLGLINNATGPGLTINDALGWTYQLIHRTASACELEAEKRAVVYQYFGSDPKAAEYYRSQLAALSGRIGETTKISFHLMQIPLHKKPAYEDLQEKWRSGARDLSVSIRAALVKGTLLDFRTPCVQKL